MKVHNVTQAQPSLSVSRSASVVIDVNNDVMYGVGKVDENTLDVKNVTCNGTMAGQEAEQIVKLEENLLDLWEHGPAQLTLSQEMRITYLEEKLERADEDNKYLEAMIDIRNADFAKYYDLHWKEKIQGEHLEELVENLKTELEEKDKSLKLALCKLDALKKADMVSKELTSAQKQLAKSTLALVEKQKKTKFMTAHTVSYCTTKPREEVKKEMIEAENREREKRRNVQKAEVDAMVSAVDRIAAGYDRYQNVSTIITFSEPRSDVVVPDHLFIWVEQDMIALWLFTVEPTVEEQEKYEKHLLKQLRPDPIFSPTLPKAHVNWHRLNSNMKRNLPQPVPVAVQGCCQVPEFYTTEKGMLNESGLSYCKFVTSSGYPFGVELGFQTSMGVLAPPVESVHGYQFCMETGTWIIAAEGG